MWRVVIEHFLLLLGKTEKESGVFSLIALFYCLKFLTFYHFLFYEHFY